jgi:hypothetical protein
MSEPTYYIRRFCFHENHPDHHRVVARGLPLEAAQRWCQDPATAGDDADRGQWFDGYDREDTP